MIRRLLFLGLFISAVILYAFRGNSTFDNWRGSGVRGSGVERTETRELRSFKSVDVGGAFDVEIIAGAKKHSIEISGDDNVLEYIETQVESGVLRITTKKFLFPKAHLRLRVSAEMLTSLSSSGTSDVALSGIDNEQFTLETSGAGSVRGTITTKDLRIETSGAGDVHLGGTTKTLAIETSGAADIDASELTADNVRVVVSGAGDVNVHAKNELDVSVSGAGDIRYSGNPTIINKDISGVGSVHKKE
ncbi:MAG: DUF2807 domain-containing protein [Candidatus Kapaibacterium sp.]|nr:MAG: DUF2807 domain-containing protein [Candidatus Kapabacteria bacterium]